jgi:hypothetical protein
MILYFDTFITNQPLHFASGHFAPTIDILNKIRLFESPYKEQKKSDIFKFTLSSYLDYSWDGIFINYECENESDSDSIRKWIGDNFADVEIATKRSDNSEKWISNLKKISKDNLWVFFSPNNDHPIISSDLIDFRYYEEEANKLEILYPDCIVSILYSHFPEFWNSIFPGGNLYDLNSPKGHISVVKETGNYYVVKCSRTPLDSIFIHRKNNLIKFFESSNPSARVVRLEDVSDKLFYDEPSIVLIPKTEVCRHYDSYVHTNCSDVSKYVTPHSVPVLFIPSGFFEGQIKINYGGESNVGNHLNVNPYSNVYSFEDISTGSDFCLFYSELPFFIRKRVVEIMNKNLVELSGISKASRLIYNPWIDLPWYYKFVNLYKSKFKAILNIIK